MSRTKKILIWSACLLTVVVIALPFLAHSKRRSKKIPRCHFNLMQIDLIKYDWAGNEGKTTNDTPTWDDLRPYFPDFMTNSIYWTNGRPICPNGGIYKIGKVGERPKCSIGGGYEHSLSPC